MQVATRTTTSQTLGLPRVQGLGFRVCQWGYCSHHTGSEMRKSAEDFVNKISGICRTKPLFPNYGILGFWGLGLGFRV